MSRRGGAFRVVSFVLAAALLGVAGLLLVLPAPRDDAGPSVFSTRIGGRRALFLLLGELGFDVSAWSRAPGHLPRTRACLFLPATPEPAPSYGTATPGGEGTERVRSSRRLRDRMHYRYFVEEGGTLVAATTDGRLELLEEELGIEELAELTVRRRQDEGPRAATLVTGETLELDLPRWSFFGPLDVVSPFDTLVADDEGRPLALQLELGRGRLVLLAGDDVLDNRRIGDADNGVFAVRVFELAAAGGPILFDEYALGGWTPETPLELAFAPGSARFTLHLLLLGALALWAVAWAGAFPRDPEPLGQLSPLERARGLAGMLVARRRWRLLGTMLQDGVLRRLGPRRSRSAESPPENERRRMREQRVARDLDRLLRPLGAELDLAGARELFDRAPESAVELDELAHDLARLEREVGRLARTPVTQKR